MPLTGDLATFDFADLLDWAQRRSKTGQLVLRRLSTEKRLGFEAGRLRSSISNDPRETLGQALVRDELVSEEQLFRALLRQEREGRRLGEILVADGLLDTQRLRRVLESKAEETTYDVFLWSAGEFEYEDGPLAPTSAALDMDVQLVLAEGLHRRAQWQELRRRLPSVEARFRRLHPEADPGGPVERRLCELAAADRTLASMSLETRRSLYETTLRLDALVARRLLSPELPADDAPEPDPVGVIRALLRQAEELRRDHRHDAAMRLYEEVLGLDRLNQDAKKGLLAAAAERRAFRLANRLPLDKVPVVRLGAVALTREQFDSHEGFVLSRINGQWTVGAILKLCPMPEAEALAIFLRLLDRQVITLS